MKKFFEIKNQKPFKKADLFLFIFLIATFLILFFSFFNTTNDKLSKITVEVANEKCFTFDFDKKDYSINQTFTDKITVEKDNNLYTVVINNDGHINLVLIDASKNTVKITDSNCPGKDCVYSKEISTVSERIVCVPHQLYIYSDGNFIPDPSTGV